MTVTEQPWSLRYDCANCPTPAGGPGVLRIENGGPPAVSCAACHTFNHVVPGTEVEQAAEVTPCPDCGHPLVLASGPCGHCGLTRRAIHAVWELRRLYAEVITEVTARHAKAVELTIALFPRSH